MSVEGDGNCFFNAFAFQLSNLMSSPSTNGDIIAHLRYLGMTASMSHQELATLLRKLLAEERKGDRSNDYV